MKNLILVIMVMGAVACANSGPIEIGKDTYSISTRVAFSGAAGARGEALQTASTFCLQQNRYVLLETEHSEECALHGGCGQTEITFMCLDKNDPRYKSVHMR